MLRRSLMLSHVSCSNHWKFMISSSNHGVLPHVQTGLARHRGVLLSRLDPDPGRSTSSVSAAILLMVSRWRTTASTASLSPARFWEQFMIVTKTSIYTVCVYVVLVSFRLAPLLETCFTMTESCPTHTACGTLAFT